MQSKLTWAELEAIRDEIAEDQELFDERMEREFNTLEDEKFDHELDEMGFAPELLGVA